MTTSVRHYGGGHDLVAGDSAVGGFGPAAGSGPTYIAGGPATDASIEPDSAMSIEPEALAPANDPLMRAIEIGLAGLAFGSAILLALLH
jgi:hypothetical protein